MSGNGTLITTQIQHLRDELETIIRGSIPELEPHLAVLKNLADMVERIATTSPDDTAHLLGAVRGYSATFMHFISILRGMVVALEGQVAASEDAREEAAGRLHEARTAEGTTEELRGREIARLQGIIADLEEVATGGDTILLKKARALVTKLVAALDQALGDTGRFEESALSLLHDAGLLFTEGPVTLTALEEHITALSQQTAPLRAQRLRLDTDALKALEKHSSAFDEIQKTQAGLAQELAMFHELKREWDTAVATTQRASRELLRRLDAASIIFPEMGIDLFALVKTSIAAVNEKRKVLTALQLKLSQARSALETALTAQEQALERQTTRVEEQRALLEPLRTALLASVDTYQGLSPTDQRIARALTLCFTGEPRDKLSEPTIVFMLVAAGVTEVAGSGDTALELLASLPFFRKTGRAEFKMQTLTDDGHYWHKRWTLEDGTLAAQMRDARERADVERLAHAEQEGRRRQEAEAERERREQARLDPVNIYRKLNVAEKEVLSAIALASELPHHRNMIAWARILAAGRVANLIAATKSPKMLAKTLQRILMHDPSLFKLQANPSGGSVLIKNRTGSGVCDLLPLQPEPVVVLFDGLINHATRAWPNAAAVKMFQDIKAACEPLVHQIPAEQYTVADDKTQP